MPLLTQIIGFSAAVIGSSIMLPQVIRSYRTKSVGDISPVMLGMLLLNAVLWFTYGLLIGNIPVTLTNCVAFVIVSVQIFLKVRYEKQP